MTYLPTIGLEIHVELKTRTKMFCESLNDPDERHPNINVCPICMGHPGTLPVINREAVRKVIQVGLALDGEISPLTLFERKNYFYPDLPKGYQISQYQHPLVRGGYLEINLPNVSRIDSNESRIVLKDESYRLMQLLFEVHNKLGPIYKEKNYCDAVEEVLKHERIPYERERKIVLKFENLEVSNFFADFVVDNKILLEVKAKPFITNDDIRQASRYINSLGIPLAIVINFKRQKLESKRVINPAFEKRPNSFEKDSRKIRIQRIHLEEDTGRLIHLSNAPQINSNNSQIFEKNSVVFERDLGVTLVDFNRAGIPLMELVTEPDLRSAAEARAFAEELQRILQYLDASDADMEKGEMRIEVNVSLRPLPNVSQMNSNESRIFWKDSGSFEKDSEKLGTKVEIKNINSFRFAEKAIAYEIERQKSLLEQGERVRQETRGWDEQQGKTVPQRTKEESHDYRYFPEPDLPPLKIQAAEIEELRRALPELPRGKERRFVHEFQIDPQLARTLVAAKDLAAFFEAAASELRAWLDATGGDPKDPKPLKLAANYITTDLAKLLNETGGAASDMRITPENFAELITYLAGDKISSAAAKRVLALMYAAGADPSLIIEEQKLWQVTDTETLAATVERIIERQPAAVQDFKRGKREALQFLLGQVMKEAAGANPAVVRQLLEEKLKGSTS